MSLESGTVLGSYEVLGLLGAGGMGEVYRARDRKLGREVALKVLPEELGRDPERRARFEREARLLASLNHPNVAGLYGFEQDQNLRFLVMELVPGETLAEKIERGALSVAEAEALFLQIADGLEAAHGKGVVHRDLKPSNISVTPEGRAKLLDFGLAKGTDGASDAQDLSQSPTMARAATAAGIILGTTPYMSPEQTRAQSVDRRTDVWAFGCCWFEALTGRRAFEGLTVADVISAVVSREPDWSLLPREVSPSLRSLLRACLEKDPGRRLDDIGRVRELVSARPRAKSLRSLALVCIGLTLASGIIWLAGNRERGSDRPAGSRTAVAVLPFTVRGSADLAYLGEGMVNLLGTKLDGAGNLRSVDSRALLSLVKRRGLDLLDPSESRSLANELDASHYVTGDILEAGGRIQIEAALYPSAGEGEPLVRASAEGDTAHLFDLVDSVAAKLLVGMSGGPSARVTRIAGVTTSSLDALRAYLEVESAFRAGSFGKAVEAYQRAVEQDPDFALAYYRLSLAAEWGFLTELSETAAREANERSGRLAERERRLVEALLAWREGEYADAERMYRSLVGSYPDDVEARFQLGEVRFHTGPLVGRSIVEAREDFEGVLSYEPEDTAALVHLARIDAMEGRVDSLASTNQRFQTLNPEGERALEVEALLAFSLGNADEEDRFSRKIAKEGDPGLSVVVWSVGAYTENFDGLGKLGRVMASASRSEDSRLLGHAWLAHLELGGGRRAKALEEIRSMDAFAPGPALENLALLASVPVLPVSREELRVVLRDLSGLDPSAIRRSDATSFLFNAHNSLHAVLVSYLRGLASARLGDGEAASRFADELQTLAVPSFVASLPADLARGVRATLLREQGKLPEALAELREIRNEGFYHWTLASPFCSLAYERFLRAEILLELGEIDQAYSWYESLAGTSPFELLYRGMTHYRRGQIDERRGRKEEARRHYQRFLKLWKDADPEGRPLVDDARARLGRL